MNENKLGKRIKRFREQQEMSLEQLAERSGVSLSLLTALEENDLSPSLGPLLKVARTLGVRLGTFIDDVENQDPYVVRKADRSLKISTRHDGRMAPALHFYSLGKGKIDRHMEPFFIELAPEGERPMELSSHEGEEFIVVVTGEVAIRRGDTTLVLSAGDSIYFNSVVPHSVTCHGQASASIYAILYFPE